MSKDCENLYKTCRNNARLTQEQAAERLNVGVRTMSDYENGHAKVPDDIVKAMVKLYNAPMLALWHLSETSPLGEFIPKVIMPVTDNDMLAQICTAERRLESVVKDIQEILFDGQVDADERPAFDKSIRDIRLITAKLMSAVVYTDTERG